MSNTAEQNQSKLTVALAVEMSGAVARLDEIKNLSALSKTREVEAEAEALVEYLAAKLIEHARILLGCYFVVEQEYSPLIRALIPVVSRISAVLSAPGKTAVESPTLAIVKEPSNE